MQIAIQNSRVRFSRLTWRAGAFAFSAFVVSSVIAQAPAAAPAPAAVSEAPLPYIDAARELSGRKLLDALRAGGYNLYMRHAEQIPPKTDACEPINLTSRGVEQARRVGAAIRELKIPIGEVRTSEPCRNVDTAKTLGLGEYKVRKELNPGLEYGAPRTNMLMEMPVAGTNTILVSHVHGSRNKDEWMHLELGEVIVYQPNGKTPTAPVARIRVEGWDELLRLAK
ncbi:MAG: hypothetical protein JNN20_08540 [Betaproteobacteria bacterium]|nr:hypothetical protein [Betaproteobacteria bacterium]